MDGSLSDAVDSTAAQGRRAPLPLLTAIAPEPWRVLAARAIEPNGYYLPDWELAVNASARGRTGVHVLTAWSHAADTGHDTAPRLSGLLPVVSAWDAYRLPLQALVSADPYGTLGTPPIDRDIATEAISGLLQRARTAGAHALVLRNMSLDGPAMQAFTEVLRQQGLAPRVLQSHARACLDATRDADDLLRDALGTKKLKELRRLRNRLAEHGDVTFRVARTPADVSTELEVFLELEASGWKAKRGTALRQDEGDAAFIRRATAALAAHDRCEIVILRAGATPVAGAIVLRHQDRAFYFKIGIDERFAKLSPGVQLTLDLTRHLCADPSIRTADSTANAGHPMIDPIWRDRLSIGDVLLPLRRRDLQVELVHAALAARLLCRGALRGGLHAFRKVLHRMR
ncbi:GNAT family N-acetyltransferase [Rhodopseudomonas sp. P2A-2r]|uniref:GNAT family N-acetyltransferase n=1 Tax=unclassified Rhodopseudomonas TaxID=2638247 RepID=UPI0022346BC8|nr:GNAT family N-acetyltransferase [Rhodopseudomonas sp. P2A-2r]UZE52124.1 GNAT family N-acetyltransferase [Rhodopseudomonas sp. P2A-2r]